MLNDYPIKLSCATGQKKATMRAILLKPPDTLRHKRRLMLEIHDLRNAGLKVTIPRIKILQILEKQVNERHLTAEQVYKIF